MLNFKKTAAVLVSLGALALAGCGSSSDSNSSTPVSVDTAKAAAAASLAKAINAAVKAVSTVVNDSTATNVVLGKGVMNFPLSARVQADVLSQFKKISASPALRAVTTARAVNGLAAAATTPTTDVTDDEIKQYFGTPTQVGNTITWTINADAKCADPFMTVTEKAQCRARIAHFTLVQTVEDADTGTLTIKVDTTALLVIGYDTSTVYLEINLAGIKAVGVLDGAASADLPATLVGAVRLTVTVKNATAGAESAAIKLGITTAINVASTLINGPYNLQMAVADKLFEIAADAAAKTATLTVGVGLVDVDYHFTDNFGTHPSKFHLGGLTGTFELTSTTLTATNVGISNMKADNDTADVESATGSTATLAPFDFTVNGATSVVTFTKALSFQVTNDFAGTVDDGGVTASAIVDTEVKVIKNVDGSTTNQVMAGSVSITGTGNLADGGPINATPSSNSCFTDDYLTSFGLKVVACPL